MARPIDFAPPFGATDAVGTPTDPRDERIEVGVAIVGGGPGGLACAIRLGQLLEEHPEVRERLGEVPVAVSRKGSRQARTSSREQLSIPARCASSSVAGSPWPTCRRTARFPARPCTSCRGARPCASRRRRPCGTTATSSSRCRRSVGSSRSRRRLSESRCSPRRLRRSSSSSMAASSASERATAGEGGKESRWRRSSREATSSPGSPCWQRGRRGTSPGAAIEQFGLQGRTRRSGRSG